MTKSENRAVLFKNTKHFIIKFICSLLIRAFLLVIPIYYSYGIDAITNGNYQVAYNMIIMFFIFTMLYRFSEVLNQITYYKLYSNLYKTYLEMGIAKTCNNPTKPIPAVLPSTIVLGLHEVTKVSIIFEVFSVVIDVET